MAIIGNVYKIEKFLKDKNVKVVFDYFKEALEKNSKVSQRIFSLPLGSFQRYDINEEIFAIEQVFYTKNREECFIESHKKYIDFQLILSGNELMEHIDIDKLEVDMAYDEKKDLITYKLVDNTSRILLQAQDLAVYFPDDAHIGLPKYKESELVHKTVIKFSIELWNQYED
ncbi:YhcH/YjgK/YiaL family protein [bacterium]|nr:YhcH/YjgK/YiaL family protein [bacterium]MBU1433506.1 YhcH/YjgK/YiaL family protein [bacterium]MBU1503312.1 YhcH/YjgK/YiaL family protein [bacterium]